MYKASDKVSHAQFTLPKTEGLSTSHPLNDTKNEKKLREYCLDRMKLDLPNRDTRVLKYSQIDRDVAGFVKLSKEDKKRAQKHAADGSPQATQLSLPLAWVHLDDMMTYYAQTFAPNRGMFYHTANPDNSQVATQLVAIMNHHAIYGSYYRHLLRAIFNLLKYNSGGFTAAWATETGPKLVMDESGDTQLGTQTVFAGNKIDALDMYNLFYDPSVIPDMLHKDGEWFATVKLRSHFWLKKRCLDGLYFNCDEILNGESQTVEASYYKHPPTESRLQNDESNGDGYGVNWVKWMQGTDGPIAGNAFELVTMYINLNPNDFGLISGTKAEKAARNRYEVWKITILNGKRVIEATYTKNIHGYLPIFMGVINDDFMEDSAKSPAEILNPLQQFSSHLLNAHVLANRKNLFGITYYDPTRIDLDKIPAGEVSARVPIKPQGFGDDIRTMIYHDDNTLDTKQTLEDLQGMLGIIDQFFPTQSLPSQIAGIDRAIDSQVAAVQQGTNRRQQKGARLIDDTMMRPFRFAAYYNIVQFQKDGAEVADFFKGENIEVDLSQLRESNLSHLIGQGLKAIDRQQTAGQLREVIFAMIQAPAVAERIDILALIDHWTTMLDIDTNMKQFEIQAPPPEQAPAGAEGTSGTGINPATAPEAIAGGPIYGA